MAWVHPGYVERARGLGFDLVSWSENDPGVVVMLTRLGFDYVCTDEPAMAVDTATTASSV
jgi:hypothetical protein